MVFDPLRRRLVVFGGRDASSSTLDDTWEWNGVTWSRVSPVNRPPARFGARMVFDRARGRLLLFGGMEVRSYQAVYYDDLWQWNGRNWTPIAVAAGPVARTDHAMVFDTVRNRTVVRGGKNLRSSRLTDTWEFDGSRWSQRQTTTQPLVHPGAAAWFDVASGRTMLFGQRFFPRMPTPPRQETWALDASGWNLVTTFAPGLQQQVSLAHDPLRTRTVMFGGGTGGDTWEFNGGVWGVAQRGQVPAPRFGRTSALAFDSNRAVTVMVQGRGTQVETWERDSRRWTRRLGVGGPAISSGQAIAFDSRRNRLVLFGGNSVNGNRQTWEYDGRAWTQMAPRVRPPQLANPAMVFDPVRSQIVLFGAPSNSQPSQTWVWDGRNWTKKTPATVPWGRTNARAAWHPDRGTVVAYGGGDPMTTNAMFSDLWEWDGNNWTLLANTVPPGPRSWHQIVYDSARACLVVHGGRRLSNWLTDTWEWGKAGWVQRTTAADPGKTSNFDMSFDAARRRTVVFGGASIATWTYGPDFPAMTRSYGSGCLGSAGIPNLSSDARSLPWLGGDYRQVLTKVPARAPVFLMFGLSDQRWAGNRLPFDLSFLGMTGCSLLTSADVMVPLMADAGGIARHAAPVPNRPALLGGRVFSQVFAIDARANRLGGTMSNALAVQIGGR